MDPTHKALMIGGGAVALLIIIVLWAMSGSGSPPPPLPDTPNLGESEAVSDDPKSPTPEPTGPSRPERWSETPEHLRGFATELREAVEAALARYKTALADERDRAGSGLVAPINGLYRRRTERYVNGNGVKRKLLDKTNFAHPTASQPLVEAFRKAGEFAEFAAASIDREDSTEATERQVLERAAAVSALLVRVFTALDALDAED